MNEMPKSNSWVKYTVHLQFVSIYYEHQNNPICRLSRLVANHQRYIPIPGTIISELNLFPLPTIQSPGPIRQLEQVAVTTTGHLTPRQV